MSDDARPRIVGNAHWGPAHRDRIFYTESFARWMGMGHPYTLPLFADCSSKVTLNYNWADAPDPNKTGYRSGYTGTLIRAGKPVNLAQIVPGDVAVYGPYDGVHAGTVVVAGPDPILESHGRPGQPVFVRNSVLLSLGDVRWFRYSTKRLHPIRKKAHRVVHGAGSRRFYVAPISRAS